MPSKKITIKKNTATANSVKPKKHLGQHFLTDETIALQIAQSLQNTTYTTLLEVGAGSGALSKYLLKDPRYRVVLCEIDTESIAYLQKHFPLQENQLITRDFLTLSLNDFSESIGIIGNFPYHISTQIFFHIWQHENKVIEVVGMLQKEVAERIAAKPGSKSYGILSVLLQAFYTIDYLFTVPASAFFPPPKVLSGVIRLQRREKPLIATDKEKFKNIVKIAFNQRRKTLKNAFAAYPFPAHFNDFSHPFWKLRAEALSVEDFDTLAQML